MQPIALVAGLAVVKVDVHHHRDHPQLLEVVVTEAVRLVPLLATPFQILDELGVVEVAVDVDLGAAHHRFHSHRLVICVVLFSTLNMVSAAPDEDAPLEE